MSAHDETEKVLRKMHILLSKSEPYNKEPSKVIVDKQEVLNLLSDLNKAVYSIYDEYELTKQSRDRAEREFRKQGDQIVWDASRKAEDIYAASVMYTEEALNRVFSIMHDTAEKVYVLNAQMESSLKEQEKNLKDNQRELKSQLQDLRDTEKYLKLIEERNRELEKQKEIGSSHLRRESNIYANRQTEIKVNNNYMEKMGYGSEDAFVEEAVDSVAANSTEEKSTKPEIKVNTDLITKTKEKKDMSPEELEREEKMRADLDADYFDWKDDKSEKEDKKEAGDFSEGISKMWKNIKSGKKMF